MSNNANASAPVAPVAKTEPQVTSGTLLGKRACNLFIPGTKEPLRDENGALIVDPNKTELIMSDGSRHRVRTANITGQFKFGATCHLLWAKIDGYNAGEAFVDVVMID